MLYVYHIQIIMLFCLGIVKIYSLEQRNERITMSNQLVGKDKRLTVSFYAHV